MEHIKVSYLFAVILAHGVIVICQNVTQPADNPVIMMSSKLSTKPIVTLSVVLEPLEPSTPVGNVVTEAVMTSSSLVKEISPSPVVPESLGKTIPSLAKQTTPSHSEGKMTSSQMPKILASSQQANESSLQEKEEMTSSKALQTVMSPTKGMSAVAHEEMTISLQMGILTSSEAMKTAVAEHSSQQIEYLTLLQPNTPMMSSPVEYILTSSQVEQSSSQIQHMILTQRARKVTSFPLRNVMTLSQSLQLIPDLTTSSPPDVTSSSDVNMTTTQESIASSSTTTGFEVRVEQQSTSSTSAGFEVRVEQQSTSEHHVTQHPTHPTHHEDKHTTHTHPDKSHKNITQSPHDVHVTHHAMGTPYEPDVDAATGDEEENGGSWEVSIIVVLALLSGMLAFVFFMIIKDRARTGRTNLKDRKLPVIGDDHGFKPLKEVTEEKEPKLTHVEKRNSQRFSYHGDPEDAIPLLELHMRDGEPPLLNANVESQDTEPQETSLKPKPLLDVYGDGNTSMSPGKSKEKVSEEA